jgi:hypothetical protein
MTLYTLIVLLSIVMLPLVPAYVLFKLLKSSGRVDGTFHGFRVDLGGSFAGYFVLFFVLIYTRSEWLPAPYEVWNLRGQIEDENGSPLVDESGKSMDYVDPRYVTVSPPNLDNLTMGGKFNVKIVATKKPGGRGFDFPDLVINYPGYRHVIIPLGPDSQKGQSDNSSPQLSRSDGEILAGIIRLKPIPKTDNSMSNKSPYPN